MTISISNLCMSREVPCQLIERKAFFFPSPNVATYHEFSFFNLRTVFIYLIFGCAGSSLLHVGFSLVAVSRGVLSHCSAQAFPCSGFSCKAQALGHVGLSSRGSPALENRLGSCGTQA